MRASKPFEYDDDDENEGRVEDKARRVKSLIMCYAFPAALILFFIVFAYFLFRNLV